MQLCLHAVLHHHDSNIVVVQHCEYPVCFVHQNIKETTLVIVSVDVTGYTAISETKHMVSTAFPRD